MYQVLDNGKPADCHNHNVDQSWDKSTHETWEQANDYANAWLGGYGTYLLIPGQKVNYSGYGDTIEIKEI